ncbi:MAG: class I SAM-dependent methyltransferase [Vulcanimicrobiota bacterium]
MDWDSEYRKAREGAHLLWDTYRVEDVLKDVLKDVLPADHCNGYAMDIGCGQGTDLIYLSTKGFQAVGVDISFYALMEARRRIPPSGRETTLLTGRNADLRSAGSHVMQQRCAVMLIQADGRCLPFRRSLFSFVNDRGCFHHIAVHERMRFASEAARVTESGGIFLLRCFGERYFDTGGAGIPLRRDDIKKSFSPFFSVGEITDYTGFVDTIPVDMCWCRMTRM